MIGVAGDAGPRPGAVGEDPLRGQGAAGADDEGDEDDAIDVERTIDPRNLRRVRFSTDPAVTQASALLTPSASGR